MYLPVLRLKGVEINVHSDLLVSIHRNTEFFCFALWLLRIFPFAG